MIYFILIRALFALLVRRKGTVCICELSEVLSSQLTLDPQIATPQIENVGLANREHLRKVCNTYKLSMSAKYSYYSSRFAICGTYLYRSPAFAGR
jgi:hypothetical protein